MTYYLQITSSIGRPDEDAEQVNGMKRPCMRVRLCRGAFCGDVFADTLRPNVLLAIADDGGLHGGAYGTRWVKTPAFDRVARGGARRHPPGRGP